MSNTATTQPTNRFGVRVRIGDASAPVARIESMSIRQTDLLAPREARKAWRDYRESEGLAGSPRLTTEPTGNSKLSHSVRPVVSLSLAPAASSGIQVCSHRTAGCVACCVGSDVTGRASFDPRILRARAVRTRFMMSNPRAALTLIVDELERETHRGPYGRQRVAFRPNAFSDIAIERFAPWLVDGSIARVDSYDYTKRPDREPIGRYRLIHSVSEHDDADAIRGKLHDGPTAIVVDAPKHSAPIRIAGYPTHDGDRCDYSNATRGPNVLVVLAAKGTRASRAAMRRRGFARSVADWETMLSQ